MYPVQDALICVKTALVMIVYPENDWYGKVDSEDVVSSILDAVAEGKKAEDYLLTD